MAVYNTFIFAEGQNMQFTAILSRLRSSGRPKRNDTPERQRFLICKQTTKQSIEQYVTELKRIRTLLLRT